MLDAINKRMRENASRIAELEAELSASQNRLSDALNAATSQHRDELEQLRSSHEKELKEAIENSKQQCKPSLCHCLLDTIPSY